MKFRSFFLLLLASLPVFSASAQLLNPVKWHFSAQKVNDTTYDLHLKALLEKGWHIYSVYMGEGGPIPTTLNFDDNPAIDFVELPKELGQLEKVYDKNFKMTVKYFSDTVDLVQRVTLKGAGTVVKGVVSYQTCDEKQCLPPKEVNFAIPIGHVMAGTTAAAPANDSTAVFKNEAGADDASGKSLWWIFAACFAGGFLALLTPCVFSMIPVTVSFFTKRSETKAQGIRNALLYSLSIVLIYTLLGFIITKIFGSNALNELASNMVANLLFFAIFIVFGISFLGAFDINLPSSWANRADARAGMGSMAGIFFMALTLTIVSFSCTGPIIGNLLVLAAKGGNAGPLIGMFGFSLALAIPFSLFAVFPGWLNKVAKSGGWLNAVKVTLGFLELAVALKFLSTVDMAYHWGILSKEVFLALWIVIFSLMGWYLLGKLKFSHDSEVPHLSVTRLFFAMAAFAFAVYLVPGLFGAHFKGRLISGFLPNYSSTLSLVRDSKGEGESSANGIQPMKYADLFPTPEGYTTFFDYEEALAAARRLKKPLMLDFTGWSCTNCRNMESEVWSDPRVKKMLNEDFIIVSLYVDDKTPLPENEQYVSKISGNKVKNIGQKNADLEAARFNRNSQPYYVFLDQHERLLSDIGYGYDPDVQKFLHHLEAVKAAYRQRNP